jgi:hypothetical protein
VTPAGMPLRPVPFLGVALLFAALCLPLVWSNRTSNYTYDEDQYHLPAVRQIRAHWPGLDLRHDSLSATAPGYHYLLATLSWVTGSDRRPLRLVTFAVSLALLGLLWVVFPREHAVLGASAVLPLATSNFFVKSASWIVTDNPALLAMTATLALILLAPRPAATAWAGGWAAAAVFIRQMYAWLVAPILLRVWFDRRSGRDGARWTWALAALPPLAVVGLLAIAWGGLVPPAWHEAHYPAGANPAAPLVCGLAVLGGMGGFYYCALARTNWRTDFGGWSARIGAGLGLALALAGPTTRSMPAGRWGGYLWDLAEHLPAPAGRSIVFLGLAPLGGAIAGVLFERLRVESGHATAWLWLASYTAWLLSYAPNRLVFQRYFEPATLVFLVFWLLLILRARPERHPAWCGPLGVLAVAQVMITLLTAHYRVFFG